jgi:hypothetical protein
MAIKLHGKDYVEVKDRVIAAHAEESYSMLQEEMFEMGGRAYCRVFIDVKGKQYIGTAEIKFNAKANTPDGMSPFECGETSALGRALGFAGYGVVESIASADEVVRNQEDEPATPAQPSKTRDEALHDLAKPGPARMGNPLTNGDGTPALTKEQGAQLADAETMDKIRAFCKSLKREAPREALDQATADKLLHTLQVDWMDAKAKKAPATSGK